MIYKILTINNSWAMSLDKTKLRLYRFLKKHRVLVKNAGVNIRPSYFDKDSFSGRSYRGYDNADSDFICNKIRNLDLIFSGINRRFQCDYKDFDNEKKIATELLSAKKRVEQVLVELNEIEIRNRDRDYSQYPLKVCYATFKEINDDLEEIISSEEMISFLYEIELNTLEYENLKLEFGIIWQTKLLRYTLHFLAFIPFLGSCLYVLLYNDDVDYATNENVTIVVSGCIMTILLHLFLNTKNSFNESFKYILLKSRKNLREKKWQTFLKQQS
ncbi:hypothetical protein [Flavobacterium poyangense]|uniref:hypothetical protein n=1 Tax=Flavobacterium poyangense TaxID=2204302 RepID=UPI0014239299|nr:hypothetical protein [Flavobacterium sp. JXAS1]